ncbi:hypothetical protein ACWCOP_08180 [Maricaulaceae bacterium MS644]
MENELQIIRSELEDANVFVVRLIGRNRVRDSRENALLLSKRMVNEARIGLIMDYRECQLDHTLSEFEEVGRIFAANLPAGLRVAYVYASENFMHAARMTKILHKAGFPARCTSGFDEAAAFAKGED